MYMLRVEGLLMTDLISLSITTFVEMITRSIQVTISLLSIKKPPTVCLTIGG